MAAVTCVLLTTPSASDRRSMLKRLAAWYSSLRLSAASLISLSGGYTALVCARAHSSHSCGSSPHTRPVCILLDLGSSFAPAAPACLVPATHLDSPPGTLSRAAGPAHVVLVRCSFTFFFALVLDLACAYLRVRRSLR